MIAMIRLALNMIDRRFGHRGTFINLMRMGCDVAADSGMATTRDWRSSLTRNTFGDAIDALPLC